MKRCSKCKQWKEKKEFSKNRTEKDGLQSWCKECFNKRSKRNYKIRREKRILYARRYHREHRTEILLKQRQNYQLNREKELAKSKEYRERNRDKLKARGKARYWFDPEKARQLDRKYYWKNRKKCVAKTKRWQEKNKKLWLAFLNKTKPKPRCEICRKSLQYLSGDKNNCVCFDHKKDNLPIKTQPSTWLYRSPFSPKNVRIWKFCNFGIICIKCNFLLPTKDRKKWLKNITRYIFNS